MSTFFFLFIFVSGFSLLLRCSQGRSLGRGSQGKVCKNAINHGEEHHQTQMEVRSAGIKAVQLQSIVSGWNAKI